MKELQNIDGHPIIATSNQSNELGQLLRGILNWSPQKRLDLSEVLSSDWMNDKTLITVKYLDKISNYESKQQLEFLKGLAGVLDDFPERVLLRIIIPKLLDLLKFSNLIASIVFIIIDLLKKNKVQEGVFKKQVWPSLKTVTQGKEMTAQAIYLFVLNFEIF
jgi:SCY1-like protein 2